jgi:stage V sporulation protein AF
MILILTALFRIWGFVGGVLLTVILLVTNSTVNGKRHYLYPLLPFDGRALLTLLVRRKKQSDIHANNQK